jgi:Na+/H+ antiporter NhaA
VSEEFKMQAKLGIIAASVIASLIGFLIIRKAVKRTKDYNLNLVQSGEEN